MKNKILLSLFVISLFTAGVTKTQAQTVQVNNGPALENDRDSKMNRMVNGDDNNFYCYRVRSKGKGTSFFIEKYDKKSLKPAFSKEVDLGEARTKLEDVKYANEVIYVFSRQYDKEGDKMTLYCQTVTSAGVVNPKKTEITNVTSDHYEFVDFDISFNPAHTKFLVKSSHKASKDAKYMTEFILVSIDGLKNVWNKKVDGKLFSGGGFSITIGFWTIKTKPDLEFLGLILDKDDNLFYSYMEVAKNANEKEKRYDLKLAMMSSAATTPKIMTLPFDDNYFVSDIEFSKSKDNEVVVGGFIKDIIERKGRDLVKCGIFSFTVDIEGAKILAHPVKFFDDNMLKALESNARRSRHFKYKLDYILPVGNDVFYVGEQYKEEYVSNNRTGMGMMGGAMGGMSGGQWVYEYMDVIVAKINAKGEFEWITNAPLRNNVTLPYQHVFRQYFAVPTEKNIYIFNNDHPKNIERYQKADFEPEDLKSVTGIHGSIFVFSAVTTTTGKITHKLIFENETYCFAPIQERNPQFVPPSDAEIFVPGLNKEFYVYTEDRGKDRFTKLKIVE